MLQRQSASFPLLTDVNFGASFGLLSAYFKTRASNPASVGLVRLAVGDTIDWRNNANSANLPLAVNGFDQLTFNGSVITTGATSVTGIIGTNNEVLANGTFGSPQTGNVTLTTPQAIGLTSSPTFQNLTLTGNPALAATGGVSDFAGVNVFDGGNLTLFNSGSSKTLAISAQPTTSYHLFMPQTQGAANSFLQDDGSGNLSWSSTLTGATIDSAILGTALNANSNKITSLTQGTTTGDAIAFPVAAGQIANNTITAAQIAAATITSAQIASNTVTGSTANSGGSAGNIAQGTVSTPDFRSNAVTNVQSVVGGNGGVAVTNAASVVITTIGKPVLILAQLQLTGTSVGGDINITATVDRGGSQIGGGFAVLVSNTGGGGTEHKVITMHTIETPSAGTYTYHLNYNTTGLSGVSVENANLILIEQRA